MLFVTPNQLIEPHNKSAANEPNNKRAKNTQPDCFKPSRTKLHRDFVFINGFPFLQEHRERVKVLRLPSSAYLLCEKTVDLNVARNIKQPSSDPAPALYIGRGCDGGVIGGSYTNTILVVVAFSSQPRVGSAVTDEMSLMESCRPSVRGDFTVTSAGSQVCWFTFWCGAGL